MAEFFEEVGRGAQAFAGGDAGAVGGVGGGGEGGGGQVEDSAEFDDHGQDGAVVAAGPGRVGEQGRELAAGGAAVLGSVVGRWS